jgi:hypothetical protein
MSGFVIEEVTNNALISGYLRGVRLRGKKELPSRAASVLARGNRPVLLQPK